jgi:hypothetical protein
MKKTLLLVGSIVLAVLLFAGCQDVTKVEGDVNTISGPDNLAVHSQGPGYVLLTWDSREEVNYYDVYRKEVDGDKGAVYLDSTRSSSYFDQASLTNGLADGKKYQYFVSNSNGGPASSSDVTTDSAVSVPPVGTALPFPTIDAGSVTLQKYSTQTGTDPENDALIVSLPANLLYRYQIRVERRTSAGATDWLGATVLGGTTVDPSNAAIDGIYTGTIKANISLANYGYVLDETGYDYRVAVYYSGLTSSSSMGYKVLTKVADTINGQNFIVAKY